jgi:hypothetical protein
MTCARHSRSRSLILSHQAKRRGLADVFQSRKFLTVKLFWSSRTPSFLSSTSLVARTHSRDGREEPLGLHVVYEPECERSVDIIFVHGLGGTCRLSWSWNRDLSLFWPQEWLPQEPELTAARILTFGYNANFMSPSRDTFNISDFAKDLLLQMRFGTDSNVKSLDIGEVRLMQRRATEKPRAS